jgi:predicted dehydrogenase
MLSSSDPTRPQVSLIGVSGYAHVYYALLQELREQGTIDLCAATIVNPQDEPEKVAALQALGCPVYADHREMLARHAGAIDLCCIPTGIPLHAPMTIAALEAGANVLVEKPLAPTAREVEAIRAAESRSGRFVAVGFQDIYAAETMQLKQRVLAGAIGRLRRIRGRGLWPRDTGYYRRNNWAGQRQLAGNWVLDSPLSNAFSHFLNLALFFAGAAPAVPAAAAAVAADLLRAQEIENFDTAALRVRAANGVEILFYVSHSSRETLEPELVLEGDGGRAVWSSGREIRLEPVGRPAEGIALGDAYAVRRTMFQQVVRKLRAPATFVCDIAIAAEHTRCCQLAQESAVLAVPEAWVRRERTPAGEERISIEGIEDLIDRAWNAGQLFREVGYAWPPVAAEPFRPAPSL